MNIKQKLTRMKSHLSTPNSQTVAPLQPPPVTEKQTVPYKDAWDALSASIHFLDDAYMIKREVAYPLDYQHGNHTFQELYDVCSRWENETANHPLHSCGRRPEDFLFFDTETTGLNSGTGNMIFLLGGAQFTGENVKVSQYFLPGPEAEVALYYHFLSDTPPTHSLVSYNGKSFDWPQLKTRHTLVREEVPKLPAFGHYDLLHAARRLFRNRLSSCILSVVEKEILGITRKDDTPGYLAPMLYFDFLQDPHPDFVKGVLTHNEWDVLTLITLYIDLSKRVLQPTANDAEMFEIGKWYAHVKEWEKAEWCYEKVTVTTTCKELRLNSHFLLGHVLKKQQRIPEAQIHFQAAATEGSAHRYGAIIELAKYQEHQLKDFEKALSYSLTAQRLARDAKSRLESEKRVTRLQKKLPGNAN
ncbi:ribonuclease H-like domain-containing protein [Bacillus piscicola]|uniref:ribonuclease H-like domain-containing protein n=1 Tax=Bacillus piscicola TaxID=1632684 RepID=UPI001F0A0280|nr:ribonuclease H-like domain-containing protein [Bacillus piscicola]